MHIAGKQFYFLKEDGALFYDIRRERCGNQLWVIFPTGFSSFPCVSLSLEFEAEVMLGRAMHVITVKQYPYSHSFYKENDADESHNSKECCWRVSAGLVCYSPCFIQHSATSSHLEFQLNVYLLILQCTSALMYYIK